MAIEGRAAGRAADAPVLKLEQWPKDKVPAGRHGPLWKTSRAAAPGPSSIAGEPILDSKLAPKGINAPGADIMIPKGYRVVSIRVDAVSGGGNLLLPGCRVDILVHMAKNPAMGIRETTTRTILQDIKVFAVNEVVGVEAGGGGDQVDPGADGLAPGHSRAGGEGDAGHGDGQRSSW